jgi:hypothetical protein
MAGFLLEREDREKRPASDLLDRALHRLNAPRVLLFFNPKRFSLRFNFWHPGETQKPHLLLNHPLWLVVGSRLVVILLRIHREILCKRISWIVAQTMARQLVSVVNTSI